jgi:hypothetical protein
MRNDTCDMCDGSGVGSGGWRGICGYCDGTGEGACAECRYPSSDRNPPSACGDHGASQEGRERSRNLRASALASGRVD